MLGTICGSLLHFCPFPRNRHLIPKQGQRYRPPTRRGIHFAQQFHKNKLLEPQIALLHPQPTAVVVVFVGRGARGVLVVCVGRFFGFFRRIVQHCRAKAVFAALAHQDVVVDTTLATLPELVVLGELAVRYGFITKVGVDFHHRQTRGQAKYFGVGVFFPRQLKYFALDPLGQAPFAIGGCHDKARIGHKSAVAPSFDVAKSGPRPVGGKRDHGLALGHFGADVRRLAFGDARTAHFGRGLHLVADGLGQMKMFFGGDVYFKRCGIVHCCCVLRV